jgi:hypothetical protein
MNDIRGGHVISYMIDIRYSAVAEFRGGQVPGSSKLGQRPKGASWEIIIGGQSLISRDSNMKSQKLKCGGCCP